MGVWINASATRSTTCLRPIQPGARSNPPWAVACQSPRSIPRFSSLKDNVCPLLSSRGTLIAYGQTSNKLNHCSRSTFDQKSGHQVSANQTFDKPKFLVTLLPPLLGLQNFLAFGSFSNQGVGNIFHTTSGLQALEPRRHGAGLSDFPSMLSVPAIRVCDDQIETWHRPSAPICSAPCISPFAHTSSLRPGSSAFAKIDSDESQVTL